MGQDGLGYQDRSAAAFAFVDGRTRGGGRARGEAVVSEFKRAYDLEAEPEIPPVIIAYTDRLGR